MTAREAARALLVMDLVVGRLPREAAEARVTDLEQALRAEVLTEAADLLQATLAELMPGMPADTALAPGLGVAEGMIRRMAAPTTTKVQCGRCNGSGVDPEHSSPGCTDPDQGVEPPTLEPCIACQYPKEQP